MLTAAPLLCALLAAIPATRSTPGGHLDLKTRVRGIDLAGEGCIAARALVGPGRHRGIGYTYGETVVDRANQYNGRVFDPGTGFHDYGARMYWPEIGRFISVDSAGPDLSRPMTLNRYSYVLNNPYRFVDPDGRFEGDANAYQAAAAAAPAVAAGAGWVTAGTLVLWTGGAAIAGGGGWLAGTWLNDHWLGPHIQNLLDKVLGPPGDSSSAASQPEASNGRAGGQQRLQAIAEDPNTSSADRGWIKQEQNAIERGQRDTIRNPPGKQLAHTRGREAAKGYDHVESPSNLQDTSLHQTQHKLDDFGRANKERP